MWLQLQIGAVTHKHTGLQAILEASELKKDGQTQKVIVTGCLAQRYSNDLAGRASLTLLMTHTLARPGSKLARGGLERRYQAMILAPKTAFKLRHNVAS